MRLRLSGLAALVLLASCLGAPPAAAGQVAGACPLRRIDGETTQHFSARVITCAVDTFGPVAGGAPRAICIAQRESGLIPTAASPTGMYVGLFQQLASAWPDRYAEWTDPTWELPPRATNPRSNAIVTIRMVVDAGSWKSAGWPPQDC